MMASTIRALYCLEVYNEWCSVKRESPWRTGNDHLHGISIKPAKRSRVQERFQIGIVFLWFVVMCKQLFDANLRLQDLIG